MKTESFFSSNSEPVNEKDAAINGETAEKPEGEFSAENAADKNESVLKDEQPKNTDSFPPDEQKNVEKNESAAKEKQERHTESYFSDGKNSIRNDAAASDHFCYSCFHEIGPNDTVCPFCGAAVSYEPKEAIFLKPGTVLNNRFVVGEELSQGGFGIVYKGWDRELESIVAIKELYRGGLVTRIPGSTNLTINLKTREQFLFDKERFIAEARIMALFNDQASIPTVYSYFEENNTAYIVMELLEGCSIHTFIEKSNGKIELNFALKIINDVGEALTALHAKNIIHRDIAPDNIYLCNSKEIKIKLLDLGAAKLSDDTDDKIEIITKPGYSPIEQYNPEDFRENVGPWSDVYALGATLYRMLTGKRPDESSNRKEKDNLVPPRELNPDIPENVSNAILKAMELNRYARFKNVKEFLKAINGEKKVMAPEVEKRRKKIKKILSISLSVVAALTAILIAYSVLKSKNPAALEPADIQIWFAGTSESDKAMALNTIAEDFRSSNPAVNVELRAIPPENYENELQQAAASGQMPNLFESSGMPSDVMSHTIPLDDIAASELFGNCLFLDRYYSVCYPDKKMLPLAINVPVAVIITKGPNYIDYEGTYFHNTDDFGSQAVIAYDEDYRQLFVANGLLASSDSISLDKGDFLNTAENKANVLLSTVAVLSDSDFRTALIDRGKTFAYPNNEQVMCSFEWEWSVAGGSTAENEAAKVLLNRMLGASYQNYLLISVSNSGLLPVNKECFLKKIQTNNLLPIADIYSDFCFER